MVSPPPLRKVVGTLAAFYGPQPAPPAKGALELVLWENVAYLAGDEKRTAAFALLKKTVGTAPQRILDAPAVALQAVAAHGILAGRFAGRLRDVARIALDDFGGDLDAAVAGPVPKAKKALRKFPGIGEPGADKILLFLGRHPTLAPESNALRVLGRLGIIREEKSYAAGYTAAQKAAAAELGDEYAVLVTAHGLLRRHGQELCKRGAPLCDRCPVASVCLYALKRGG